jgi:hypothetical protein
MSKSCDKITKTPKGITHNNRIPGREERGKERAETCSKMA